MLEGRNVLTHDRVLWLGEEDRRGSGLINSIQHRDVVQHLEKGGLLNEVKVGFRL